MVWMSRRIRYRAQRAASETCVFIDAKGMAVRWNHSHPPWEDIGRSHTARPRRVACDDTARTILPALLARLGARLAESWGRPFTLAAA